MIVRYYTAGQCSLCRSFLKKFENLAKRLNASFEKIDVDSDPLTAIFYIRKYSDIITQVPFYSIHPDSNPEEDLLYGDAVTANFEDIESFINTYGYK
jgi:thiol-disulfide isomerase/thioredoxin